MSQEVGSQEVGSREVGSSGVGTPTPAPAIGPLTVGTAGHIDHGKTRLVHALTGRDTDRLPEERRRGISIDLGYAQLQLPGGRSVSLVDVPGHERFVRTMVAGATGIDLFLLVLDAAEGARPQTLEHLEIIRLLGIEHGVVAVTKADKVDEETLELALDEARELVPGAPVVATSAVSGLGLEELRDEIGRVAATVEPRRPDGPPRLHVDRVFTLRGIGTVVTGTLWSGSIGEGDRLRVEPRGLEVRVRSVQVHDIPVERAEAGQRVALNLPGVERHEIERGDALVAPGSYPVTYRLDVALTDEGELPAAVTVHHGTAAVPARVVRRGRFAQLRLARAVVAARGDRVVLRTSTTVGGGRVVDPSPPRRVEADRLELIALGEFASTIHEPVRRATVQHLLDAEPEGVVSAGEWLFSAAWLDDLRADLAQRIAAADPLDPGVDAPAEPWAAAVVPLLGFERRGSRLVDPATAAQAAELEARAAAVAGELDAAGLHGMRLDDQRLARALEELGRLVRLGDGSVIGQDAYRQAREALLAECAADGKVTLPRYRDRLGVGRKTAQLLLERFDTDGLTRRIGDERVLRRAARS